MQTEWLTEDFDHETLILVGDIGGTNTNLGLVGRKDGKFHLLVKGLFKSAEIENFLEPLKTFLDALVAKDASLKPHLCCVSGAGPVEDNYCIPTNIGWHIDGAAIEKLLGAPTAIINDFMAISYSLPLLDVKNPNQITPLPHAEDGSIPEPDGETRAIVGAGTGLGVGYLIGTKGAYKAYPSEGGHTGLAAFDAETRQLQEYLTERIGKLLDAELVVSGQGLSHIYHFFKDIKQTPIEGALTEIENTPDDKKPALISKNADTDLTCRRIMDLFVKCYGRFAGDVSTFYLPSRGMYIGGGIAGKNEKYFLENDLFMRYFIDTYSPNIRRVLKTIPVYIIKDYSISLHGAANAAHCLLG